MCEREWATAEFNNNKKKGRANIFKKRNMPVCVCVCSSIVVCVLVCVCFCVCRVCLSVCLIASVLSVPRINYLATLCSNSTNFLCFNALCGRCIINSSRFGVGGKRDFNVMISISRVICYVYKNVNTRPHYVGMAIKETG